MMSTAAYESLTERERYFLRLTHEGLESKDISRSEEARGLKISRHTIDGVFRAANRKVGVSTRLEAARLLVAFEASTQLSTQSPEVATERNDGQVPPADRIADVVREEATPFTYGTDVSHRRRRDQESRAHELTPLQNVAILIALIVLLAIIGLAARPLGAEFQRLANIVDPPTKN